MSDLQFVWNFTSQKHTALSSTRKNCLRYAVTCCTILRCLSFLTLRMLLFLGRWQPFWRRCRSTTCDHGIGACSVYVTSRSCGYRYERRKNYALPRTAVLPIWLPRNRKVPPTPLEAVNPCEFTDMPQYQRLRNIIFFRLNCCQPEAQRRWIAFNRCVTLWTGSGWSFVWMACVIQFLEATWFAMSLNFALRRGAFFIRSSPSRAQCHAWRI